ncbi:N-acetylmuramoyl-L-alanine amidase [Fusobacterium polymorphum]|uniref:N-acetylmuramoyl-L-alanine amidase n=1 Tax=Fusobacterium nucleatum subsp. polymorphum TaxID=76857 RepID=A0A2C6BP67_FUSNP|nr:N-acetylmuramoyl-L-alanine amidase [Fusobacterium polymorphum]PHI06013.1 N-acetylmuramoyl-L-alanine amidase [Fusobacterium polymorphum]
MKVALVIGHNKRSKGAYSTIVGSEYDYWKRITEKIKTEIPLMVDIYERKPNQYYTREMFEVLEELNKNDYKFCMELHFNAAASEQANGCECLVYFGNNKAKALATDFMARLQNKFGSKIRTKENVIKVTMHEKRIDGKTWEEERKETTRGLILVQDSKTRGGYGICKSKDTYILVEPFFGTNNEEALKFSVEKDVVDLFVNFIKENI